MVNMWRMAFLVSCALTHMTVNTETCTEWRQSMQNTLEKDIRDYFSIIRNHQVDNGAGKTSARQYISRVFNGLEADGFITIINSREIHGSAPVLVNENYIGVIKGEKWNSSHDKIVVLGAHYDTIAESPGLNDNGAAAASVLHVARLLHSCHPTYTIIIVALDMEECNPLNPSSRPVPGTDIDTCLAGSELFVRYLIAEYLEKDRGSFQGAIILDTITNYESTPNTQNVGPIEDAAQLVPSFAPVLDKVKARDYRGNFLTAIARHSWDDHLLSAFGRNFPLVDDLIHLKLPFNRNDSLKVPFNDFYRSDHANFWIQSESTLPAGLNYLPAIFLTDTGEFRQNCVNGQCQHCYHEACDDAEHMLDEDNLRFLAATTEGVAGALSDLAQCRDPPVMLALCNSSRITQGATSTFNLLFIVTVMCWIMT